MILKITRTLELKAFAVPGTLVLVTFQDECESQEDCKVEDGYVCHRLGDDTLFEGCYDQGVPHGYFRHINSYGDLEFFGCFFRGTMLGKQR